MKLTFRIGKTSVSAFGHENLLFRGIFAHTLFQRSIQFYVQMFVFFPIPETTQNQGNILKDITTFPRKEGVIIRSKALALHVQASRHEGDPGTHVIAKLVSYLGGFLLL